MDAVKKKSVITLRGKLPDCFQDPQYELELVKQDDSGSMELNHTFKLSYPIGNGFILRIKVYKTDNIKDGEIINYSSKEQDVIEGITYSYNVKITNQDCRLQPNMKQLQWSEGLYILSVNFHGIYFEISFKIKGGPKNV